MTTRCGPGPVPRLLGHRRYDEGDTTIERPGARNATDSTAATSVDDGDEPTTRNSDVPRQQAAGEAAGSSVCPARQYFAGGNKNEREHILHNLSQGGWGTKDLGAKQNDMHYYACASIRCPLVVGSSAGACTRGVGRGVCGRPSLRADRPTASSGLPATIGAAQWRHVVLCRILAEPQIGGEFVSELDRFGFVRNTSSRIAQFDTVSSTLPVTTFKVPEFHT